MIDKTKTVEEQMGEIKFELAKIVSNYKDDIWHFIEGNDEVVNLESPDEVADTLLSQPITKPGGKCIWCLSGYYNLYDLKGGLPYCLKRTKCSYCKGTGILPDQTTTLKELIEGYLRR